MTKSTNGHTTKQENYYIDFDAEDTKDAENAEQKHIEQHMCSQKDHMAIAQENREMKSII